MRVWRGLRIGLMAMFIAGISAGWHAGARPAIAADPTTTITYFHGAPDTTIVNQSLTVTVVVSHTPDGGTLTLKADGVTIDTKSATPAIVDFQWTPTTTGNAELQAFFSGTANFTASQTDPHPIEVLPPPVSSVVVTSDPSSGAVVDQDVEFTATVNPDPGDGEIEWTVSGQGVVATTDLAADGTSTWTSSFASSGDKVIRARFVGNDTYSQRSSQDYHLWVNGKGMTVTVAIVGGSPRAPGPVTANVTLSPNPGGGTLGWAMCHACSETQVPADADGTTAIDLGSRTPDFYTLEVRFVPDGTWGESVGTAAFQVWNTTTTTLTTDRTTAYVGELPVKLTATVAPNELTGGTVTFRDVVNGAAVNFGPYPINTSTFQAVFSSSSLRVGVHTITATFNSVQWYLGSTSSAVTVNVLADTSVHATFAPSMARFYPANDGYKDKVRLGGVLSEKATVKIKVINGAGTTKRTWDLGLRNPGSFGVDWNGKTSAGSRLPAGTYTVKAIIKDTAGHSRSITGATAISWRSVIWKSVTVTRYGEAGAYFVGDFGGALYYSPDYPRGRILDSGEMIRDCTECGFVAGRFRWTVVSTSVLAYRNLFIEMRGHGFTDREHPGSAGLIDPATGALALQRSLPEYDIVGQTHGIPFTSAYINASKQIEAWIWMDQAWGDAWDVNFLRLTYQYAVWA